ncbi:MAG: glucosamine-6-phosphate deaminase [Lachnospiraceae bacterium]|nr:glucosamine-6-phosphate deaminase [Lachnospiraceae bacterium]
MKVIKAKNYDELSRKAAQIIASVVISKPRAVLGLATGSTPIGTYKELVRMNKAGDLDFSQVTTVNLDEYAGLDPSNDQSYRYFMNDNLFDHINIDKKNTYVPNGLASDLAAEGARYDAFIESLGGTDIQLLGIGHDGHIGFNEPDDVFYKATHEVKLDAMTIKANARFFENEDAVPRRAVTMGMWAIMQSKKILLIASGDDKRDIVERSISGPVTPKIPASILQCHRDVTVIYTY